MYGCRLPWSRQDFCLSHRLLRRGLENRIPTGNSGDPALDEVLDTEIGHFGVEGAQRA